MIENGTGIPRFRAAPGPTTRLRPRAAVRVTATGRPGPTEAVRKPFCGPSRRKIDSNRTRSTHQRFAEIATSILLLRMINGLQRFYTAWTHNCRSLESIAMTAHGPVTHLASAREQRRGCWESGPSEAIRFTRLPHRRGRAASWVTGGSVAPFSI